MRNGAMRPLFAKELTIRVLMTVHQADAGLWAALPGKAGGQGSPPSPVPPTQVSASANQAPLSHLRRKDMRPAPPCVQSCLTLCPECVDEVWATSSLTAASQRSAVWWSHAVTVKATCSEGMRSSRVAKTVPSAPTLKSMLLVS